ncbi:MAG TPA: MGMT family protein [Anaerolineaceae bacterium]|nr:MGMT family protein [Anaerolineaceae bacterium]
MDQTWNAPPDPQRFDPLVWEIARQIPAGKVFTYGQIAALIPPSPGVPAEEFGAHRARWAGSAMSRCPDDVPWQRVVNSQGKISFSNPKMQNRQRELLKAEGIEFDARERIDLAHYGWRGPGDDWLQAHGLLPPEQKFQQGSLL